MQGLAINGGQSAIAQALVKHWLGPTETVIQVARGEDMPLDTVRYLFCQGLLYSKPIAEQTEAEQADSFKVNFDWVRRQCDRIIAANDRARICVMGSESGFAGSYDGSYAHHKQLLHCYVEKKTLRTTDQQLICLAPTIIADAGMTIRRNDLENVITRGEQHPKGRWLLSDEVAGLIHHVLYIDQGYLSGVTIRMNGGAHNAKAQNSKAG